MISSLRTIILALAAVLFAPPGSLLVSQQMPDKPQGTADEASIEKLVTLTEESESHYQPKLKTRHERYELNISDVMDITFPLTAEFNQTVTIQPDGYINLRAVDDVRVAGSTVPEAIEAIKSAYAGVLKDPIVDIELTDFQKPYFIAGGQVGKPGKYELRETITLAQAVAIAGGFTEAAKHSQVLLFRPVSDSLMEVKEVNLKSMLAQADLTEDTFIRSGDMVYIPKNMLSKIKSFIPRLSVGPRW